MDTNKVKGAKFKKLLKMHILVFYIKLTRHPSAVDCKMCKYEMDPTNIEEDT